MSSHLACRPAYQNSPTNSTYSYTAPKPSAASKLVVSRGHDLDFFGAGEGTLLFGAVTFFVTICPHNPHTQCNAMQSRLAATRRLTRRNPAVYAEIDYLCGRQGLVFLNRGSRIRRLRQPLGFQSGAGASTMVGSPRLHLFSTVVNLAASTS
jgi:hypothetical protein